MTCPFTSRSTSLTSRYHPSWTTAINEARSANNAHTCLCLLRQVLHQLWRAQQAYLHDVCACWGPDSEEKRLRDEIWRLLGIIRCYQTALRDLVDGNNKPHPYVNTFMSQTAEACDAQLWSWEHSEDKWGIVSLEGRSAWQRSYERVQSFHVLKRLDGLYDVRNWQVPEDDPTEVRWYDPLED